MCLEGTSRVESQPQRLRLAFNNRGKYPLARRMINCSTATAYWSRCRNELLCSSLDRLLYAIWHPIPRIPGGVHSTTRGRLEKLDA